MTKNSKMSWCGLCFFQVYITNLSREDPARVNCQVIDKPVKLNHGDVFTVIDRSFRFECCNKKSTDCQKNCVDVKVSQKINFNACEHIIMQF